MIRLPDWLTGYDSDNAERAAAADAELRRLNEERAPLFTEDWYAQVQENYARQEPIGEEAQRTQIQQAFDEGLDTGAGNVTGFFRGIFGFIGKALSAVLLGIPFWVWTLGAVAVFLWLGGGGWLTRKARSKFA